MSETNDWNKGVIEEFRANEGRVGGNFEGAPMILVHHKGTKTGNEYVTPLLSLPSDDDSNVIYIFASKAGAPEDPTWYHNLTAAGHTTVEFGSETFDVDVAEVTGEDRDRVYAEQVSRYPGFGEYEEKTAGIRTIPVLALTRR
jgi:deazaflavin-dependent oxidoreductase (nitroreductase family)